jgi:hypothetical protein
VSLALSRGPSFDAEVSLNAYVNVGRKEKQYSREKKPCQEIFVLLLWIGRYQNHTRGKSPTAQNVQWDKYSPLKSTHTCGLEFDDAEHSHHEKGGSESNQEVSHHLDFLSGARK